MSVTTLEIRASQLAELVKSVIPLASTDRMLPVINTVKIEARGEYLTAAATDCFRMGVSRVKPESVPPTEFDALIRVSELRQILAIFKATKNDDPVLTVALVVGPDGPKRIRVSQSGGFSFIDASMTFPLQEGDFPGIAKLLAKCSNESAKPASNAALNPSYLASFQRATRERNEPLVIHSSDYSKPVIITAGDYFIGALMPVRMPADASDITQEWVAFLNGDESAKSAGDKEEVAA